MRLERIFVEHFVFLLSYCEPLLVALVVLELFGDFVFLIICAHILIFDQDAVCFALVDESVVLQVSYLSFGTCLQLFPCLLLDHGGVGVIVLALQADLFKLLRKSCILLGLVSLLLVDFLVSFNQALITHGFLLGFKSILFRFLLLSSHVIFSFAFLSGFLDLGGSFHEFGSFLVLFGKVILPLLLCVLLQLPLIEFNTLSQLSDGHFLKKTVAASLRRVETFGPDNRYLLELSDLSDKLLLSLVLEFFFISLTFECISDLLINLIPKISVLLLHLSNSLSGLILL